MSATKILWGQITVVFAIVLIAMWAATQWVASGHDSPARLLSAMPWWLGLGVIDQVSSERVSISV